MNPGEIETNMTAYGTQKVTSHGTSRVHYDDMPRPKLWS